MKKIHIRSAKNTNWGLALLPARSDLQELQATVSRESTQFCAAAAAGSIMVSTEQQGIWPSRKAFFLG